MLNVLYDESQGNNTWWFNTLSDGRKLVVTRCANGHIGSLLDHQISTDGTVSPSVVCQHEGCTFHEFIKLDDYERRNNPMSYDSTKYTQEHIENVRALLSDIISEIADRSLFHDESKLKEPEKSMYDEFTPKLKDSTYGSEEYKGFLRDMGAALKHHYENNSHHPEHYPNGINGMSLLDLVEMLADWKAAGMRHANGSMTQSLEVNKKRFNISDQLFEIIQNTVKELEW